MRSFLDRLVQTTNAGCLAAAAVLGSIHAAVAFDSVSGVALDAAGNLYVADAGNFEQGRTGNISILAVKAGPKGVTTSVLGTITSNILYPRSVAVAPFGTIYAGNSGNNTITAYAPNLSQTGTVSVSYPVSMFVDGGGDVFALDGDGRVHVFLDTLASASTLTVGGIATAMTQWGSNVAIWGRNSTGISTLTANVGETVHGGAAFNGNFPSNSLVPTGAAEDSLHLQYVTNSSAATMTVFSADFASVVATASVYGGPIAIDSMHNLIYTGAGSYVYIYSLKPPYKYVGQLL